MLLNSTYILVTTYSLVKRRQLLHYQCLCLLTDVIIRSSGVCQGKKIIQAPGTFSSFPGAAKAAGWLVIIKADGYVLESDVHFPIDMNLLLDAFYKQITLP
ncbi:MAG: hypothetical protein E3K40_04715 [Candidatus Brocadia sp.]|nr:hypothetical protein [Candidatus Brocadia sp.]